MLKVGGQGRAGVVPGKNLQTASEHQVVNYILSTNHKAQRFSIKILSFIHPNPEGAELKRKMFAETETRVASIPPCSEWMLDRLIFSPGCLNSSYLKVSFNFFHGCWGGGGL